MDEAFMSDAESKAAKVKVEKILNLKKNLKFFTSY